jgi:selenocysteine-specific elongation factor
MKNLIIGTAGHIDHGKTALTKALTGIDTDRLPEEKEREMTIDLGFAPFALRDDLEVSIIDVPGHERFVKNMVAGAATVDMVLLVIAANEGIMPQTREHLQILSLLGIKTGIVVITKTDLTDPDILAVVKDEIVDFIKLTFLKDAPIVETSAVTGSGIENLKQEILKLAESIEPKDTEGIFRLPIDRVFTMSGFGTVVTGTTITGKTKVGDTLEILPQGIKARVRGIQVHNQPREFAAAGERTAVNLADIEKAELLRGDLITVPDLLKSTAFITVQLTLLPDAKPLKNKTRVRFHCLTKEVLARLRLFDRADIIPGAQALVQLALEEPASVLHNDRFIIRSYSPSHTIGGGRVVDAFAGKIKKGDEKNLAGIQSLAAKEGAALIEAFLLIREPYFLSIEELARFTNEPPKQVSAMLDELDRTGKVARVKKGAVHKAILDQWQKSVTDALEAYFKNNPHHLEMPKSELKIDKIIPEPVLEQIFNIVQSKGIVQAIGDRLRLLTRNVDLPPLALKIEQAFQQGGYQPPDLAAVASRLGIKPDDLRKNITTLAELGRLVDAGEGIIFHKSVVDDAIAKLRNSYKGEKSITVGDFRQSLNTTRKYALPLLNHFDKIGVTRRKGDVRFVSGG